MFKLGLLTSTLAIAASLTFAPASGEDSPEQVAADRWVASIRIKAEDGTHEGPTWYFGKTFAARAECDQFLRSTEWTNTFLDWAAHEIAEHDGKVEIPTPVCVQRRDIQPYPPEKGA